ncbi:hypothetical protein [Methylobacterium nigriterrae]|uniref:hypothetical protein n=1 Tax=Methylobacterium nigriterrae TaxID=3127512 RepID=UPI003013B736
MTRLGLLLLSVAVACLPAAAEEAGSVVVRQGIRPASAVIGQRVTVFVDVLFPGEMPAPPQVKLPEVPGAQVFRFESQGTTLQDRLGGSPYVGQRFEFALFPRRGGNLSVPPARVTLLDRRQVPADTVAGQAAALAVRVPPGVDASQPVVATTRLSLGQRWEPSPTDRIEVGGALKRTVVREAEDVPALAMQDLRGPMPEGVRAYDDPPDADDRSNRGTLTGRRVDRITYVFEKAGAFRLPTLRQPWWDLGAQTSRTAEAMGTSVRVQARPVDAKAPLFEKARRLSMPVYALGFAVLAALLWAGRRTLSTLLAWRGSRRRSERAEFRRLRRACRGTQAGPTYAALHRWRSRLGESVGASRMPDAAIDAAANRLSAILFGGAASASWTAAEARQLDARLGELRKAALAAASPTADATRLPPLNPAVRSSSSVSPAAALEPSRRAP